MVIGVGERATAADGYQARIPDFRQDHDVLSVLRASA